MNRRDAALIAHLDAIEGRVMIRFDHIETRLDTVIDALADLRRDFDRHTHGPDGGVE